MISIVQQPPEITPVYNDVVMTVVSDKVISKFKFKYVFDIFANTLGTGYAYIGRIKSTPNPAGYGMVDLSRYLQNNLGPEITWGTPIQTINTTITYPAVNSAGNYYVVCGEEYAETESGPVTLYNGDDTVSLSTTLTAKLTDIGFMFNGVNQFEEGLYWNATPYFQPTGRTFLTNSPRTLYKETDEYILLGCMYGYYSGATEQANNNLPLVAKVYDTNNTLLKTYTGTPYVNNNGTAKGMNVVSGYIDTIVSGYTNTWNKMDVYLGITTGTTSGTTETMTIYRKDCPWKKYNPIDIMFLNRYGAYDTFRFFGSKDEDVKIERGTYQSQYGTWNSVRYSYSTYERGTTNIKTDLTLQGEVMSDFIDQDTVNWLEELLTSPHVMIIGEFNTLGTTRKLIPINITDSNFKRQVRGNKKLRQVSFKYEYSNQIRTQQLGGFLGI